MKAHILIVDDDAALRRALRDRIEYWGHSCTEAQDGDAAIKAVGEREFDLILLDLAMPGRSGMEVLKELRKSGCTTDVVILTAHGSIEAAVDAVKQGASEFLPKPADFDLLKRIVERSLEQCRLRKANRALAEQRLDPGQIVIGTSEKMKQLLETATRAAQSNSVVLLTGESGCGKQVVAELIHQKSPRAQGPFVYVNCVALSDELVESTLFGHEKGAFTGAVARKEGKLETAAGGSAFLDEIGDITPRLQTKLLHFLETNEFERVGGTRTISVDCRIVAATNRDLEKAVQEDRFREDLFFRLNVIRLCIPPLRERPEDIPLLARAFLERFRTELNRGPLKLSGRTLQLLQAYSWPGNVRQLRNVIERMVVLAQTDLLSPDLLPVEIFGAEPEAIPGATDLPLKEAVHRFRRSYIAKVLAECGGNQTKAAEKLELQRTFLNRLIKEYGL